MNRQKLEFNVWFKLNILHNRFPEYFKLNQEELEEGRNCFWHFKDTEPFSNRNPKLQLCDKVSLSLLQILFEPNLGHLEAGLHGGVPLHALSPEPGRLPLGDPWWHCRHAPLLLDTLLGVQQDSDGLKVLWVHEIHCLLLLLSEGVLVSPLGNEIPATSGDNFNKVW